MVLTINQSRPWILSQPHHHERFCVEDCSAQVHTQTHSCKAPDEGVAACRRAWLLPLLVKLLPHVHQRLTSGWGALLQTSGKQGAALASVRASTREDSSAANEEIVQERLLRELTAEHLVLLRCSQGAPEGEFLDHDQKK